MNCPYRPHILSHEGVGAGLKPAPTIFLVEKFYYGLSDIF